MFKLKQIFFILFVTTTAMACWRVVILPEPHQTNAPPQAAAQSTVTPGAVSETIPQPIDTASRYLFYLHGAIVEGSSRRPVSKKFGVYEYDRILAAFAGRGFTVISEVRRRGTSPEKYAAKVAGQVGVLLKAGVAPQRITIVGASRGGGIALIASSLIRNRDVNFVILASCAESGLFKNLHTDLYGNVLSIYDRDDDTGVRSCNRFVEQSSGVNRHQEIVLTTGLGHGIVYHPLKDWLDPVFNWVAPR